MSFSNPNNQDFNGGCCELVCSNPCDVTFFICIRHYGYSPPSDDIPCEDIQHTIGAPISTSYVAFTSGQRIAGRLANPLVVEGATWPVSY